MDAIMLKLTKHSSILKFLTKWANFVSKIQKLYTVKIYQYNTQKLERESPYLFYN